ncbi:MAG: hypothetical protein CVU60_14020 [Deltaproteobacteria bacterium HGW-Deltaproteobacteria-18]|jgi:hypothetical protein|nr:MAG: hypothetical protein CVU60_14020 [Deltaproteobacteria bacterium HGW-Deltaproteobacteria-18]
MMGNSPVSKPETTTRNKEISQVVITFIDNPMETEAKAALIRDLTEVTGKVTNSKSHHCIDPSSIQ